MNPRPSWLNLGKNLVIHIVRNEEDVVKELLTQSVNYQALKKIMRTSEESKRGQFATYSVFQVYYQLSTDDEERICRLEQAKTFVQLFDTIGIDKDKLDDPASPYLEKFGTILGNVHQRVNAAIYLFRLAKEIREVASKLSYSIEHNQFQHSY